MFQKTICIDSRLVDSTPLIGDYGISKASGVEEE